MDSADLLLRADALPGVLDGWWVGPVVGPFGVVIASDRNEWGESVSLDLSRAEVRDRVARRIAEIVGLSVGSTAPDWYLAIHQGWGWVLAGGALPVHRFGAPVVDHLGPSVPHCVPALATLDPSDETLLRDGSRFVDALALKIVAEHVGREVK